MNTNLIDYFNCALKTSGESDKVSFSEVNAIAVKLGYIIHPDCCNKTVVKWLSEKTANYNATFYKEWNDIISKNRFELFIDQILHYATTYGSDFELGNGYVPNDGANCPDYKTLKVILPIEENDLYEKCIDMVMSGIALKDQTMHDVCDFIIVFFKCHFKGVRFDIDSIKCREAQAYLSNRLGIMPSDEFGILRCLMYQYALVCSIVKSKSTIYTIKNAARNFSLNKINPFDAIGEKEMVKLSRIFYRYRKIFLAMKTKDNASKINKIRKLAIKNHTPLKIGFWENIISTKRDLNLVSEKLSEIDNFKKIRLIQAVKVALFSNETDKVYPIRNGKVYIREDYTPNYDKLYLTNLLSLFENSLVESLKTKVCRVIYPKYFNITLPSSEKDFVGNYPFGTSIPLTNDGVIGIYWKNEWNNKHHTDYDLHFQDFKGNEYGWCYGYRNKNNSVVYSGDMTNAAPEATELFYCKEKCPNGIVNVNKFSGTENGKFRFFIGTEQITQMKRNYMVDPNSIKFDVMIDSNSKNQQTLGLINNGTFTLMDFQSGNDIVSHHSSHSLAFINTMCERCKCYVDLKDILSRAGFIEVSDENDCDINFNNIEKDTLIKLFVNSMPH